MTTSSLPIEPLYAETAETREMIGEERERHRAWPVYTTLFSSICILVGLVWDISWHRTIGRDTFWSPPHVLEQIAAIVAGISCGWLVLHTTFSQSPSARAMRDVSIRVWGMYGPLGAWVCIWGTAMMIVSAPFDDWWHNAYGLDVKIISPPHSVLAAGMVSIELGALLIALAVHNRTSAATRRLRMVEHGEVQSNRPLDHSANWKFNFTYILAAGVIIAMLATGQMEHAGFANMMHGSFFYKLTGAIFPLVLVAFARAANVRWAATLSAAAYMVLLLSMIWILQLFEGTPKLAPIYNPVTHMVPPPFPLLLIVPAFFIDLILQRFNSDTPWRLAVVMGLAFIVSFLAVQWFFADFLLSPYARNFFFAADRWDYNVRLGDWRYAYWNLDRDSTGAVSALAFLRGMGYATIFAILSARLGLVLGNAMRRVVR